MQLPRNALHPSQLLIRPYVSEVFSLLFSPNNFFLRIYQASIVSQRQILTQRSKSHKKSRKKKERKKYTATSVATYIYIENLFVTWMGFAEFHLFSDQRELSLTRHLYFHHIQFWLSSHRRERAGHKKQKKIEHAYERAQSEFE